MLYKNCIWGCPPRTAAHRASQALPGLSEVLSHSLCEKFSITKPLEMISFSRTLDFFAFSVSKKFFFLHGERGDEGFVPYVSCSLNIHAPFLYGAKEFSMARTTKSTSTKKSIRPLISHRARCRLRLTRCPVCRKLVDVRSTVKVEKGGETLMVCRHHIKES